MASDSVMQLTVVYSPTARDVREVQLSVDASITVRECIRLSGLPEQFPALDLESLDVGVWGRKAALNHVLRDLDRVEIYRHLTVDPKVARRERFSKQGARTAGLFVKKRPGAAAGY
jgi:putative ubiquitin-RnfH superfamily antitoxin RatB of RatAB toxin-antitoxin module